jgi:glutathione S-transferase/RNA polymerase-associated protein
MLEDLCDTYYEPINWGAFEIRAFGRATAELAEKMLARASEQIAGVNSYLEHQLGTRQFFNGDSFGWGDLSVAPYVHAAAFSGNAPAPDSRLGKWLERVRARPSVSIVFQQALDSMSAVSVIPQLIASGQFVREYRDHRLEWMLRSGGLEIVLEGMQKKNIRFTHELR